MAPCYRMNARAANAPHQGASGVSHRIADQLAAPPFASGRRLTAPVMAILPGRIIWLRQSKGSKDGIYPAQSSFPPLDRRP